MKKMEKKKEREAIKAERAANPRPRGRPRPGHKLNFHCACVQSRKEPAATKRGRTTQPLRPTERDMSRTEEAPAAAEKVRRRTQNLIGL